MNIPDIYSVFLDYPIICTDTRSLVSGSIFVALKGDSFNGNEFVNQALKVCEYAIVDEIEYKINDRCILVCDTLETLQNLASYHRKRLGTPIIAITGTNGKTTTKELIYRVLSEKYNVLSTQGNFNNHIGVPLTLLKMNKEHDFGVIEMGANHVGEIALLCKIAAPDFGIITNVGRAHLEGFGSIEGVRKAKGELYNYLYNNNGVAFINDDNEVLEDMNPPHDSILYGSRSFTHCQGKILDSDLYLKLAWYATSSLSQEDEDLDWEKKSRLIETKLVGKYNFENVLAAVCVGNNFRIKPELIKKAIESYIPDNNRSQIKKTEFNTLLLDGYNANPASMKVALDNFESLKLNNKSVILGDMLELGKATIREHGLIVGLLEKCNFENQYLIGTNFSAYKDIDGIQIFESTQEFIEYLKCNPIKGANVLIKGSRGMGLEKVAELL